jgi:uncharacterized protein YneF (UPF0154 family)
MNDMMIITVMSLAFIVGMFVGAVLTIKGEERGRNS